MLPRKFRLTKSEFQAVRKAGRLLSGRILAIILHLPADQRAMSRVRIEPKGEWQAQAGPPFPKAGLIVSRRLSPKAVDRNRLKRRLRAALQRILPDLTLGLHLVILPNRRALDSTVADLEKEIKSLITTTASK